MSYKGSKDKKCWPVQGSLQKTKLNRLGPGVAVRAECGKIPVYGYGYSYIYGVSPTFTAKRVQVQAGNTLPARKLVPKKSWEIEHNEIGATPPRVPRTARTDFQPFLEIHLIDGDPETYWCCRGQNQPDVEPAWIRIDLARETIVKSIVIVPREDNQGMPRHLCIKVSRDAYQWETVYENAKYKLPADTKPREFSFEPRPVKQIWIIGQNLPLTSWQLDFTYSIHAFSIAEVEVIDENGENIALISRGAAVTVSSFESYISSQRESHEMLWPVHYDLGVKWIRINYAGSVLNWNFVERVKGEYEIDPDADAAITQAVKNGCHIIFGLGFTNWLYTPQGWCDPKAEKQLFQQAELGVPLPRPDIPGMLEGFKNFTRFVVRSYKDRVNYFEIWNEQSGGYGGWGSTPIKLYAQYVKEVSSVIKEEHPDAKVILGSLSGLGPRRDVGLDWLKACLKEGIAPYIDAIAWHGYYGCLPEDIHWQNYPTDVEETKQLAEFHGFRGEYLHSEWCSLAPYPVQRKYNTPNPTKVFVTELMKAKNTARFAIMNLALDVKFFWNETWCDGHIDRDVGLFRNTFSASPLNPSQPQPVYYVLRTLCTVFENAYPEEFLLQFDPSDLKLEYWTFAVKGGDKLVSISLSKTPQDDSPEVVVDLSFPDSKFRRAVGIDVLNGTEQDLVLTAHGENSKLNGLILRDYPLVIRLIPER